MTLLAMAGSADVEAEAEGLATTVVSVDADALRLSLLVACASLKEACPTTSSWLMTRCEQTMNSGLEFH